MTLRVTEIYRSLQGESTRAGEPCTLVRLTGCGLRCTWCDTDYAFSGGRDMEIDQVLQAVADLGERLVLITGGEPLEQSEAPALIAALAAAGRTVMVETGGHVDIGAASAASTVVMDLKAPGSGMCERNHWPNLKRLRLSDEVKFVLAHREDYLWMRDVLQERTVDGHTLPEICTVLASPVHGRLDAAELAGWILEDHLAVRLNLQVHRLLWPTATRGV